MPQTSSSKPVIFFNISTVLVFLASYGLSQVFPEFLSITQSTLKALKIYIFCLAAWIIGVLVWVVHPKFQVANILKSLCLFVLGTIAFHIISVLYGAPLTSQVEETSHYAALLSVNTVLPACMILGPNMETWIRVFLYKSPENPLESSLCISCVCSILGAWLGAFPIPLDWDRPWQVWPVSCVIGNLIGYVVGLVISTVWLLYQQRKSRKTKLY